MKFAFLFLTYDNLILEKEILNFVGNNNIYIHPKYPEKVHKSLSKYIIKDLVLTNWGKCNIVDATLNLLKESYKNTENEWFILLSADVCPLVNYNQFAKLQNNNKSIFIYVNKYKNFYKTNQWWILKRTDVEIVLNSIDKYKHRFNNLLGACDEFYFLSVLMWHNPSYQYTNMRSVYSKWQEYTLSLHPVLINKLTPNDYKAIKESKSFFIRKITSNFKFKKTKVKKILYVLTIGTYTDQNEVLLFIMININNSDFIIFSEYNDIKDIYPKIIEHVFYVYFIKYKYYYDSILSLCIEEKHILSQWKEGIIFIPEIYNLKNFNISNISNISKTFNIIKHVIGNFNNNNNKNKFKEIKDNNNNIALSLLNI
jgi:hypothetical protein